MSKESAWGAGSSSVSGIAMILVPTRRLTASPQREITRGPPDRYRYAEGIRFSQLASYVRIRLAVGASATAILQSFPGKYARILLTTRRDGGARPAIPTLYAPVVNFGRVCRHQGGRSAGVKVPQILYWRGSSGHLPLKPRHASFTSQFRVLRLLRPTNVAPANDELPCTMFRSPGQLYSQGV